MPELYRVWCQSYWMHHHSLFQKSSLFDSSVCRNPKIILAFILKNVLKFVKPSFFPTKLIHAKVLHYLLTKKLTFPKVIKVTSFFPTKLWHDPKVIHVKVLPYLSLLNIDVSQSQCSGHPNHMSPRSSIAKFFLSKTYLESDLSPIQVTSFPSEL